MDERGNSEIERYHGELTCNAGFSILIFAQGAFARFAHTGCFIVLSQSSSSFRYSQRYREVTT